MPNAFDSNPEYTPKRDGTLEEYLDKYDGCSAFPLFRGYEHFELLYKEGWIKPNVSIIRLMWNVGRGDEHFRIINNQVMKGLKAGFHSGRAGTQNIKDILSDKNCRWELQYPRTPEQRAKEHKQLPLF